MQPHNLSEKQVSYMRRIVTLMTGNKMCHFLKPIHAYVFPSCIWSGKWSVQTVGVQFSFGFVTGDTSLHEPLHITPHLRLIEVITQ